MAEEDQQQNTVSLFMGQIGLSLDKHGQSRFLWNDCFFMQDLFEE